MKTSRNLLDRQGPQRRPRKDFVTSLRLLLTFPFPTQNIKQAVRGDYLNVFTAFDLTLRRIGETFFLRLRPEHGAWTGSSTAKLPDWRTGQPVERPTI